MKKSEILEVPIAKNYLIYSPKEELSFSDNFRLESQRVKYLPEPKDVMIAFFMSFPSSFKFLLRTRELLAGLIGLKTAPKTEKDTRVEKLKAFTGEIGESIAIFEVLDKSESELLTGQKDSHLDFKLSFISVKTTAGIRIELATTVIIHNALGRLYFKCVKPFHKYFLKKILLRMEQCLMEKVG